MDRDGFTLLAMGFTGGQAHKWKLRLLTGQGYGPGCPSA
jgi:phage regulator Rha-like protein